MPPPEANSRRFDASVELTSKRGTSEMNIKKRRVRNAIDGRAGLFRLRCFPALACELRTLYTPRCTFVLFCAGRLGVLDPARGRSNIVTCGPTVDPRATQQNATQRNALPFTRADERAFRARSSQRRGAHAVYANALLNADKEISSV